MFIIDIQTYKQTKPPQIEPRLPESYKRYIVLAYVYWPTDKL